jgi:WD40 repeat protein
MPDTRDDPTTPDDRLEEAVAEFLRCREEGGDPDPQRFLESFADVAESLLEFFAGLALFDEFAADLTPLHRQRDARARVNQRLAGFELLGELGRGGMGVVYQAIQTKLDRVVALKMIRSDDWASAEERVRFDAEARTAARLHHPNIVQIFEVGEHGGLPFLVLEFVAGGTLAERSRGEPWEPRRAAELVGTLAQALSHAHEHGVIHRDLKPANVLLTPNGEPKVADFGLARRLNAGPGLSRTGFPLGTPSYMAPEQAGAKGKEIGPAADVWALGVILYELLVGRPPFRGASVLDTLAQVRQDEPVPPSRLVGRLPRDLETICLKCLSKEPDKRYASAAALADDLQRFLTDRPILARRTGALGRARRWCRRNPGAAGMTATVAFLLLSLAAGASVAAVLINEERKTALANLELAKDSERRRTEQLATSYLEQARARRYSHQPGQHFQSLEALAEAARIVRGMKLDDITRAERLRELRNEAIACLTLTDLRPERRLADVYIDNHGTGFDQPVTFTPSWDFYARAEPDGPVSVRSLEDDREVVRLDRPAEAVGSAYILAFSPDGRYLLAKFYQVEKPIEYVVWEWRTRHTVARQSVSPSIKIAPLVDFAFTPDGRYVLLGCRADRSLGRWDLTTGQEAAALSKGPDAPWLAALDSTGRRLATGGGMGVTLRNPQTGTPLSDSPRFSDVWSLAWCPGSDLLAVGTSSKIHLLDTDTGKTRAVLEGHTSAVVKLAFNPAGTLLASQSWDSTTRLWDVADGKELLQIPARFLEFSPDGRRLAYVKGKELGIWEVADTGICRRLVYSGVSRQVRFSSDDRILALTSSEGTFLWDVASGRELACLKPPAAIVPLFHPSGAYLLNVTKSGVSRWPLRLDPDRQGQVLAGPSTTVPLPLQGRVCSAALDADGHKLLVIDTGQKDSGQTGIVLDLDGKAEPLFLKGHDGMNYGDVSPDGRWAVTGNFKGSNVMVWDLNTGKEAATFPTGDRAAALFSRDGNWLAVIDPGPELCHVYRVGSWELPVRHEQLEPGDGFLAFTTDGMMAVTCQGGRAIRLEDAASGLSWATLPSLRGDPLGYVRFSSDGGLLAVAARGCVELWNLRALRNRLANMGLD